MRYDKISTITALAFISGPGMFSWSGNIGSLTISGGATVNYNSGNIGTVNVSNGVFSVQVGQTVNIATAVNLTGTGQAQIAGTLNVQAGAIFSNNGSITSIQDNGAINVAGAFNGASPLTIGGGVSGQMTVTGTLNNSGMNITVASGGQLILRDGGAYLNANSPSYAAGSVLRYDGANPMQTMGAEFPVGGMPGNVVIERGVADVVYTGNVARIMNNATFFTIESGIFEVSNNFTNNGAVNVNNGSVLRLLA